MRIVLLFFVVVLAGCGYHTPGSSDNWVGGDARIVYVELLENRTSEPYLENYLTDALVAELSRSRLLVLTEKKVSAQVVLSGTIMEFDSNALAYGGTDQITDYRATLQVAVQLTRAGNKEILWKSELQRTEDYLAKVDKNLELEGERFAARQVSQRLAEDICAALLNNF